MKFFRFLRGLALTAGPVVTALVLMLGITLGFAIRAWTSVSPNPPAGAIGAVYPLYWSPSAGAWLSPQLDANQNLITAASVSFPFNGGSTGNGFAVNQGIAIFGSNGTTQDALKETSGSLWSLGGVSYAAGSLPTNASGTQSAVTLDPQGRVAVNPIFGTTAYNVNNGGVSPYNFGPAAAAGKVTYLLDSLLLANGPTTASLEYSASSSCSSPTVVGTYFLQTGVGFNFSITVPANQYVCLATSPATSVGGHANIVQE